LYDIAVSHYDGSWHDLNLPTSLVAVQPDDGYSIDLSSAGNPTAAWVEAGANGRQVHVASYDGTKWTLLPILDAVAAPGTNATSPVVRLDSKGALFVAWREDTADGNDIFVAHWNGSVWDSSFGSLGLAHVSGDDLVIGPNDAPVVGWVATGGMGAATWSSKWNLSTSVISYSALSVGVDANGNPLLPLRQRDTAIWAFTETGWQEQPPLPVPGANFALSVVMRTTSTHNPVVTWRNEDTARTLGLAKWTGAKWDTRPGLFHGAGTLSVVTPSLAVDSQDHMWVAWDEADQVNVWMSNY
jgi:hypothetical protein